MTQKSCLLMTRTISQHTACTVAVLRPGKALPGARSGFRAGQKALELPLSCFSDVADAAQQTEPWADNAQGHRDTKLIRFCVDNRLGVDADGRCLPSHTPGLDNVCAAASVLSTPIVSTSADTAGEVAFIAEVARSEPSAQQLQPPTGAAPSTFR